MTFASTRQNRPQRKPMPIANYCSTCEAEPGESCVNMRYSEHFATRVRRPSIRGYHKARWDMARYGKGPR